MARPFRIVSATDAHLAEMLEINREAAAYDLISRRSFKRFVHHEQAVCDVLEAEVSVAGRLEWKTVGYAILLFRKGTKLARLYSLAIAPGYQQLGWGGVLLRHVEALAQEEHSLYLRVDVPNFNHTIEFFKHHGYVKLGLKTAYFDDLGDAFTLQKQLHFFNIQQVPRVVPYLTQTTDFTCGPASLLMALAYFGKPVEAPEFEELEIWREATTIFMTSGHGGCGPHGLARAALRRGLKVELWVSQSGPVMLDSVRTHEKREVMARIQEADMAALRAQKVKVRVGDYHLERLRIDLSTGKLVIALISTFQFDQMKAPHWVLIAAADDEFVYINDPDDDLLPWQSETERQYLPVPNSTFIKAFGYGTARLRTALVLSA